MNKMAPEHGYVPKTSILINGEMVIFRPLERFDESALKAFFDHLPEHEIESLRDDVRDPETISHWVKTLDYRRVFPLVALNESSESIVGVSTLHFMSGVHRHIAEIRVVVSKEYRKLGLGSALIKELVQVGTRAGLYFIRAEIHADNQLAVKAFRQLGFEVKCTLDDHFMTRTGKTRDVVLMLKRLRANMEEDFFFVF